MPACKSSDCHYCKIGTHHPNVLAIHYSGEYIPEVAYVREALEDPQALVCTARWVSSSYGDHLSDEICGRPAVDQFGDVWVCSHHLKRMVQWAIDFVRNDNEERQRRLREYEEAHRWDPTGPSVVYYMRRADGLIKIGFSTCLSQRRQDLQREHGPLEVLLTHQGGRRVEGQMHDRFAAHRVVGEWFRPHRDLLAWIQRIKRRQESMTDDDSAAA